MERIYSLLEEAPIIAAVNSDETLERALVSECKVIFLLNGTILNARPLVDRVHNAGKVCIVHLEMIEGLSNREIAVDGLNEICHPDGIISTKSVHVRRAKQKGILALQRAFLLDSLSIRNLTAQVLSNHPDFVEVLPGILPSAIFDEIGLATNHVPLIAGGLIRTKKDVVHALNAGVLAVSTSRQELWEM